MNRKWGSALAALVVVIGLGALIWRFGGLSGIPSSQQGVTAAPTTGATAAQVGGRLVIAVEQEPDTLDAHKTANAVASDIMCFVGASLVALDAQDQIVPYLAERWTMSSDGLTWTFYLKSGVTFHDGTPFTARDYVYTFERAKNPETASRVAGALLGPVTTVTAPDDHTLVLTLEEPFFPLLANLTACSYLMPLSQAAVEGRGDGYGRQPLSVGPYRLKEWRSGEAVVLERNPAFKWGPSFAPPTPYNIETIEYRFLPDATSRLAAQEAGEIDISQIAAKDQPRLEQTGRFELYAVPLAGASPMGAMQVTQPPFDDLRVRQAFNLAVNRAGLIQTVAQGHAEAQSGPISRSVLGYWPGIKDLAYGFDVARAKTLLAEAGYTAGTDGILTKGGRPLRFPLLASAQFSKDAEILREQFKAIGADVTIEVVDGGTLSGRLRGGQYQMLLMSALYSDSDILYLLYHSTKGALPVGKIADPELDAILDKTRSTVDLAQRQTWVDQAQARIVQQAYMLPLYTPTVVTAVNKRVQGLQMSPSGALVYNTAYLQPR